MKLLLDEDVPIQLVEPLRRLLRGHQVDHVQSLGWKGNRHDTRRGVDGLALAMAAVMAAIRPVIRELDDADGHRLVEIQAILPTRRHQITDPRANPPPYWPRRQDL